MKIPALLAALFATLSTATGAAHAYESFQYMSVYYPSTPWLRGTFNNWGKSALVAANAYKYTGITYVGYVNVLAGSQQFKFDTSVKGDWSTSYGDAYLADNCLDANGPNIAFTQGAGTYEVRYNSGSTGYGCSRLSYQVTKLNTYVASVRSLYLRTSFNNWSPLPMVLARNHLWEAEVSGAPNTSGNMKFDLYGDWSASFGRPSGSDLRSYTNNGYAPTANGENLGLYLEDYSGATSVTVKIRFNDQTNEFALCRDAVRPICQ
ncbi:MAG: hypothetical protein ACLGI6_07810 [Gammaproteobacteria bacterium]